METPKLIATLPPVHRIGLAEEIVSCPSVGEVRYNVGMESTMSPDDTVRTLVELAGRYGKKLWIDLKGRQLRIDAWTHTDASVVEINREIAVEGDDVWVVPRGEEPMRLAAVRGRKLFLDGNPKHALGKGQAVNIVGGTVRMDGYLTENDVAYIGAAASQGVRSFMLSFVEQWGDIAETMSAVRANAAPEEDVETVWKIESPAGIEFLDRCDWEHPVCHDAHRIDIPMAARDDLYVQLGNDGSRTLRAISLIITENVDAIVASRIFSGIEQGGEPTLSDWCDLELMRDMGYCSFMLSDTLCHRHFRRAIEAWRQFVAMHHAYRE